MGLDIWKENWNFSTKYAKGAKYKHTRQTAMGMTGDYEREVKLGGVLFVEKDMVETLVWVQGRGYVPVACEVLEVDGWTLRIKTEFGERDVPAVWCVKVSKEITTEGTEDTKGKD